MKIHLLFLGTFFSFSVSFSQMLQRPVAAMYTGFGAYSIHHADAVSFLSNQASLAQVKNTTGAVYGEKRFLLSELSSYTAAFVLPTSSGNFGVNAGYFGGSDYNETRLGLAYGRQLGEKIDLGVQFNYTGIRIPGYGSAGALSFEAGTVMHVTRQLHVGLHVNNPAGGKFGKDQQERLPSVYSFGLGYEVSEKFFAGAELLKEEDHPVNVKAGVQYKLIPELLARAGVATATSSVWLGVGLCWKATRIDITGNYHPQLGFTPGILLLFTLKRKEE